MKTYGIALVLTLLAACATTTDIPKGEASPITSDYVANRQADGSIEIIVTGRTAAPTRTNEAKLELGSMLETAASKECPTGFDLSKDKDPSFHVNSGTLIATFRGVARCK